MSTDVTLSLGNPTKAFTIIAMAAEIIQVDTGQSTTYNNSVDETSDVLLNPVDSFSIKTCEDNTIDQTATSLVTSWNQSVSLVLNQGLTIGAFTSAFFELGKPLIISGRADLAPVVTYERAADKPIIVSDGAYGIERTISRTNRLLTVFNQAREEGESEIHTTKESDIITMDQVSDKIETGLTSAFSSVVA